MKQKMLAVGTVVKLNAKKSTYFEVSGESLARDYGLKIGESYTIKEVKDCIGKCKSRPWCPGRLRIGNMTLPQCWGFGDGTKHNWFGLTCESILLREYAFGKTLDEILGIE